ncbi:MAG TPA: hypothetical protein VH877_26785 [Polyangia bacterium]|jgi:hypothetical protein|nr:hypothetical protein [Polyangia bacterium]
MDLREHQVERALPPAGGRPARRAPEKLALVHGAFDIVSGVWLRSEPQASAASP